MRIVIFDIPNIAGDTVAPPHVRRARLYPDVCACLPHWTGRYQVSNNVQKRFVDSSLLDKMARMIGQ